MKKILFLVLGLLLLIPTAYALDISKLIAGYHFDGAVSNDVLGLKNGSGYNQSNATDYNSISGKAINFNAKRKAHVNFTDPVVPMGNKTILFFIRLNSTTDQVIMGNSLKCGYSDNNGFCLYYQSGHLVIPIGNGIPNQFIVYQGTYLNANQWYGIGIRVINNSIKANLSVFVNGAFNGSETNTTTTAETKTIGNLSIALSPVAFGPGYEGNFTIDELVVFNRSLSDAEMVQYYTQYDLWYSDSETGSLVFIPPTPANSTKRYIEKNYLDISLNATFPKFSYMRLSVYTGAGALYNLSYFSTNISSINLTNLPLGNYTYNASAYNTTGFRYNSSKRYFYLYNITPPTFTDPAANSRIAGTFNINYTNATITNKLLEVSYYSLSLLNSDYTYSTDIIGNNGLSNTYLWNYYPANITTGLHYIQANATDTQSETSSSLVPINITRNSQLNISVWDGITPISTFSVSATDLSTSEVFNYSTISYLANLSTIKGHTYSLLIEIPSYSSIYTNVTLTENYQLYNGSLLPPNSVFVNIYNISSQSLVLTNVSIEIFNTDLPFFLNNLTDTGHILFMNLTPATYTLSFSSLGYQDTTYYVTIADKSSQFLNAFLAPPSTDSVVFTITDQDTSDIIDNAFMSIETLVNGTYILTNSYYSDITGRIEFFYTPSTNYRFTLTKNNYEVKQFILNPIIFSSYTIRMKKSISQDNSIDYSEVSIVPSPSSYFNDANNNVSIIFFSPYGSLVSYSYTLEVSGTGWGASGGDNNAYGSTLTNNITIKNANFSNKVILNFSYALSSGYNHSYTTIYTIQNTNASISTFYGNKNNPYNLSLLDRLLIILVVVILGAGVAMWYAGPVGAASISFLIFGYFLAIGFINRWLILIPLILMLFLSLRWAS